MAGTAFPVTLLFADGVSQRIAVPCGGKLIEAAQEAGLNLLTDADRASGTVLPCVCRASGPCAIELPYDC